MTDPIRVLVVDDDFRVGSMHAAVVAGVPGCVLVASVTTLQQAREALPNVDLVIADQYLPDGFGCDLIGAAEASVLLVTAANEPEVVRSALIRGAVGYLIKPFELSALAERVGEYVQFRAALAALQQPTQDEVDALLARLRPRLDPGAPPKGRSAVTASAVAQLLREQGEPMDVPTVADSIGVSQATARRYLSDLVGTGDVELMLRYGTAGRPQHSYRWVR